MAVDKYKPCAGQRAEGKIGYRVMIDSVPGRLKCRLER